MASPNQLGIEGAAAVVLPKLDYRPRPLDDRTELILRIEAAPVQTNGGFIYSFHYLGFEAGSYNLADYLVRPDGSRPDEIGNVTIKVQARLPEEHNGQLLPFVPRPFPWVGGYRMFLGLLGLVWVAGIAGFVIASRKKKAIPAAAPAPTEPSLAERLRPLAEAAAAGRLDTEGKAQLERLLTGVWRERLDPGGVRVTDSLIRLKQDREARQVLLALEQWLHRRNGMSQAEVEKLVAPYREVPGGTAASERERKL